MGKQQILRLFMCPGGHLKRQGKQAMRGRKCLRFFHAFFTENRKIHRAFISKTTANGGKAEFGNLALGYYEIVETKAPDGYIMTGKTAFCIKVTDTGVQMVTRDDKTNPDEWASASTTGSVVFTVAANDKNALATVPNTPGAALPSTGGPGTHLFYLIGCILTMLAGAGIVMKKRRREAA